MRLLRVLQQGEEAETRGARAAPPSKIYPRSPHETPNKIPPTATSNKVPQQHVLLRCEARRFRIGSFKFVFLLLFYVIIVLRT